MNKSRAYLSLVIISIVWGTTYLAMRIGVTSFPPFLFSGIRHVTAGILVWLFLIFTKKKISLTSRDIAIQCIPGVLMLALGNGTIGWAEKYIPSGLAALIVSIMPVYMVLINLTLDKGKSHINWKIILGLLLGCAGIVLIFKDNLSDLGEAKYLTGVLITFAASLSWAIGTIFMKRNKTNTDSMVNIAIQLCSGGLILLLASPFLDNLHELKTITSESIWSLLYLILFGSLLCYLCYSYAIKHLPVGLVSVYAYINPFIAVILGYVWFQERITWTTAIAFITTLTGVFWINKGYKVKMAS